MDSADFMHGSSRGHGCPTLTGPALRCGVLFVASLLAAAAPASARIIKTKPSASSGWSPLLPITIGSGFEFQTDREQSEYDFPMLFEYSFTENLKLTVEPNYVYIESKTKDVRTVNGWDDLETSMEFEFLHERRYRPALSLEGLIKWPTANDPDIGSPGRDYSLGLIVSKDLVFVDLDLNLLYSFIGDPEQTNTLEISLAAEHQLNHFLALEGEVVNTMEPGASAGSRVRSVASRGRAEAGTKPRERWVSPGTSAST